jgi:hypothetical protein
MDSKLAENFDQVDADRSGGISEPEFASLSHRGR